jgi:hypothetical protein
MIEQIQPVDWNHFRFDRVFKGVLNYSFYHRGSNSVTILSKERGEKLINSK